MSNPAHLPVDTLVISATLPGELSYEAPLGQLAPDHDPDLNRLTWTVPAQAAGQPSLSLGYTARITETAPAGVLSLAAEIASPAVANPGPAVAHLTILAAAPTPTPYPRVTPEPPGPPAQIQIGIEAEAEKAGIGPKPQAQAERGYWLAVSVTDAEGRAVADQTEVILIVPGGQAAQDRLRTLGGAASTRLKVPAGQSVLITAQAGSAQASLPWPPATDDPLAESRATVLQLLKRPDQAYRGQFAAIQQARNGLRDTGSQNRRADNRSRRVEFSPAGLTFQLLHQAAPAEVIEAKQRGIAPPRPEHLSLRFHLTGLWAGGQSLLTGQPQLETSGAWAGYRLPGQPWQVLYEIGDETVEQYFIFDRGMPTGGDLVIEGQFQTPLRPVLLSDEEGIRFEPLGAKPEAKEEGEALGYGPAVVKDAAGRELLAHLELNGHQLRLIVPGDWLAQADLPLVVDPVIGPASRVSQLQGEALRPQAAYNPDDDEFLTIWDWNGDLYGQRLDSSGDRTGDLILISQADGSQQQADVVYNPTSGEYLVAWIDQRYGSPYAAVYAQRLNAGGSLSGSEILVTPPYQQLGQEGGVALAVSAAGDTLAVWEHIQSGSSYNIFGQMIEADGDLDGNLIQISGSQADQQRFPAVAYDAAAASFVVIWADRRNGSEYGLYGQRLAADGSLSGSSQLLRQVSGQNVDDTALAATGSGEFLAVWEHRLSSSDIDIHGLRLITTSTAVTTTGSLINFDPTSGGHRDPDVTAVADTKYLVIYREDGLKVSYAGYNRATGQVEGSVSDIGQKGDVAIVSGDGQSLATWEDQLVSGQSLIAGRLIPTSGSTGDTLYISPYYGRRENVRLTYQAQANPYRLAWDQATDDSAHKDIFIQVVDPHGQPAGDSLNLTDDPGASQELPDLAAGSNGALVVWQDGRNSGSSGLDIYGQMLDSSGAISGSLIALTTAAAGQSSPAVAYNSQQNNYLVAWHDDRNEGVSGSDIYGQIVSSDGTLQLAQPISLTVANTQRYVAVAYNPDADNYLLAWEDKRPGSSETDIYGQLVAGDGSLLDTTTGFSLSTGSDYQSRPAIAYSAAAGVYLVTWADARNGQWDIYGQAVSGTAASLIGGNLAIASASGSDNDQEAPAVAGRSGDTAAEFTVVWQDRRNDDDRDLYLQRLNGSGALLDEADTPADETNPEINLPVAVHEDEHYGQPAIVYNPADQVYLIAWRTRETGGIYVQRYSSSVLPLPGAGFSPAPTSGVVPLEVTFTDASTGTIASWTWAFGDGAITFANSGSPVQHTYESTGTFTVVLTTANPSGSATATSQVTVTAQITPALNEDFESWAVGEEEPTFWLDQNETPALREEFEILFLDPAINGGQAGVAMGTDYGGSAKVYATYAIPGWAEWQDYEYRGRWWQSDLNGEAGVTLYSRFPENVAQHYLFSSQRSDDHFVLSALGTSLTGQTGTGVTAQANTWYRFRVQIKTETNKVTLKAKVWPEGQAEPASWQAEAEDSSANRITSGAVGVRTWEDGTKYFDDLVVVPLSSLVTADFSVFPLSGPTSTIFQFLNSSSNATNYLWAFGDGITSTQTSPTHTYTLPATYTVSLTASNGTAFDVASRTVTVTAELDRDWQPLTPTTSLSPTVIGEHAMAYLPAPGGGSEGGVVVLYGGNATGWPYETATWEWDGSDWITTTTEGPPARYGAEMADEGSRVILFGGSNQNDTALNQTWAYTNAAWSLVSSSGPLSRTYHSLASNPISGTVYLFGGNDGTTYFDDLWKYENDTWAEISVSGDKPAARTLAALTYDPDHDRLLLFGGRNITGTILADLWAFDPGSNSWTLLDNGGGGGDPPARMAHSLTYDPAAERAVLAGGVSADGETLLGDTWHYDGAWTEAEPETPLPARAYHKAVYTDNAIILFSNEEGWKYE